MIESFNKHKDHFGINTRLRIAHFFGQIGAETGGLLDLNEADAPCYSERNVRDIFGHVTRGSGFYTYCHLFEGYEAEDLGSCPNGTISGCNPSLPDTIPLESLTIKEEFFSSNGICNNENLFNLVYSCRLGNRYFNSGDGYNFAGRGFIHITGRGTFEDISECWNIDSLYNEGTLKQFHLGPNEGGHIDEMLDNVDVSLQASMYFWKLKNINNCADMGHSVDDINRVGSKVNGVNPPNGDKERIRLTELFLKCLNELNCN